MGSQPVLFQICFHKGLGEPQENTLGEPLTFLLINYYNQLPVLIKLKVLLRHRPYNKGCRSIWRGLQLGQPDLPPTWTL